MASRPAPAKSEAQEVFQYRRETLKSPDEVLSEARKNHSIFKSNVVTGSFRPSLRNVGLSRFQFGDGEYAASVESMQRLITEKTARPEPLPEMHEPVQLTRTLSRSMSSRRNPFRSPGCTKPRLQVDDGGGVAAQAPDGEPSPGQAQLQTQSQDQGKTDTVPTEVEADAAATVASEDTCVAEPAAASSANQQAVITRSDSVTSAVAVGGPGCGPGSRGPSGGATGSRRSTSSFRSLAVNLLQSPRAGAQTSPSSGGGTGSLLSQAYWSVGSIASNIGDGDGDADAEGDASGDGIGDASGGGRQQGTTGPANTSSHASASTYPAFNNNAPTSNADSDLDSGAGSPGGAFTSSFSLFVRRSSAASPILHSNLSESSTCRVDQLLRDLRRFKVAAAAATAAAGGGGSARVSLNGSSRFESARDLFISRGRSATLNHLPEDDCTSACGGAAAAAVTVSAGGAEAADRPSNLHYSASTRHHHHHHVHYPQPMVPPQQTQQQKAQDRMSSSQLQLHYPNVPSPSAAPPGGSSPSSGVPSPLSRPGTARLSTAGAPAASAVAVAAGTHGSSLPAPSAAAGSPAAAAWAAATQPAGGASTPAAAPSQWTHRRMYSPAGDDDRPASPAHNAFSSSSMFTAAASPNPSSRTSYLSATGPGALAAAAAVAAASVAAAAPQSPASVGPAGRSSARKSIGEVPVPMPPSRSTAPGAPLDGWSSRGAGRANGNVRRHATVGSFFSNLLAAAGGQARLTGSASLPEAS